MKNIQEINVLQHKIRMNTVRLALVYPYNYLVAMQSLAVKLLYFLFNLSPERLVCERIFLPTKDNLRVSLSFENSFSAIPRSIETNTPLNNFNIIAVSLSFELDYINFIRMLQVSGINTNRKDRTETDPIIIAGGTAITANPLPMADIVDLVILGEIEPIIDELIDIFSTGDKKTIINRAIELPGVYRSEMTDPYQKPLRVETLDIIEFPTAQVRPLVPKNVNSPLDKFLIQISRGCNRKCHFCLIGNMYWHISALSLEKAIELISEGIVKTQTNRVSLIGSSIADYKHLEELLSELNNKNISFSVPSIRIDTNLKIVDEIVKNGQRSLTIAPEVANEKLRFAIGKRITNQQFIEFVKYAKLAGIKKMKSYYMIGLPNQSNEDLEELENLILALSKYYPKKSQRLTVSPFVPKMRTKLSEEYYNLEEIKSMSNYIKKNMGKMADITLPSPKWNYVQWLISTGNKDMKNILIEVSKTEGNLVDWKKVLSKSKIKSQL